MKSKFAWTPQIGPQLALIQAREIRCVFFGGARGGGKSDGLLGDFLQDVGRGYGENWKGIFFRKSYPQLEEVISRAKQIFLKCGATYKKQDRLFEWETGETIKFRFVSSVDDTDDYQGHQYAWVGLDEIGMYSDDQVLRRLIAINRNANRVVPLRLRLSGNPGGIGNNWINNRFVSYAKDGYQVVYDTDLRMEKVYIPSRVTDNHHLMKNDPTYIDRLEGVGSPDLVRAWLHGDFDVTLGAYFPELRRDRHLIKPFKIPSWWTRFRTIDWGQIHPAVIWFAVADGTYLDDNLGQFNKGDLIAYREYYPSNGVDSGERYTAQEIAEAMISLSIGENISYTTADPSMLKKSSDIVKGITLGQVFSKFGVQLIPALNDRVHGWSELRRAIKQPRFFITEDCSHLWRTMLSLQHDEKDKEDADTKGEDHLPDACRYGLTSHSYVTQNEIKVNESYIVVGKESTATYCEIFKDFGIDLDGS
jgi:hypothetical protein